MTYVQKVAAMVGILEASVVFADDVVLTEGDTAMVGL